MSTENLRAMFCHADAIDRRCGLRAYERYRDLMVSLADRYGQPLPRVVAAFVALSPNNDYLGNLRSLVTVLGAFQRGDWVGTVTTSSYRHCRDRAWAYLQGEEFETAKRGRKVLSFYRNVMDPADPRWVTVDGHVVAAWRAQDLTMREAKVRSWREYEEIADAVRWEARRVGLIPCQYQATLWFARKRFFKIRYQPQLDLFHQGDDAWRISLPADDVRPYG